MTCNDSQNFRMILRGPIVLPHEPNNKIMGRNAVSFGGELPTVWKNTV